MFRKALFHIAIWFSGCYKTRFTMALSLILPVFVVNFAFIYVQTQRELSRDLEEVRGEILAMVSSQANDFRNQIDQISYAAQVVASHMSDQTDVSGFIVETLKHNTAVDFLAVGYSPDFLKRRQTDKSLDYHLAVKAQVPTDGSEPTFHCVKFVRDKDKRIQQEQWHGYQFETWFHLPMLLKKGMWSGPDISSNTSLCYYSIPFFHHNIPVGVVVLGIRLPALFKTFGRYSKHGNSLHTFLLDGDGQILYNSNPPVACRSLYSFIHGRGVSRMFDQIDRMISGANGSFVYANTGLLDSVAHNDKVWFVHVPIRSGTNWTLVRIFSEKRVTQSIHTRIFRAWAWYTLEFVFVVFLILVLMLNIYNPIIAVSSMSQMVADGARNVSVPEKYEKLNNPMGRLAANFNYMIQELNHYIALEVEEAAKICAVNRELEMAKNIQTSLMPDCLEIDDDRIALSAHYAPAHYVAGDFYDFWKISEDQLFFLIADVSGSGVPAAIVMSSAQTLIRMATKWEKEPGRILSLVNSAMESKNRTRKFITIFLGLYNLKTGSLQYCSAGHPHPLILSKQGQVKILSDNRSCMVGVFKDAEYYTSITVLQPGETLLLYTDGVTESIADQVHCEPFGEERLYECCRTLACDDPDELVRGVVAHVQAYTRCGPCDDISLLAIKRNSDDEPLRL